MRCSSQIVHAVVATLGISAGLSAMGVAFFPSTAFAQAAQAPEDDPLVPLVAPQPPKRAKPKKRPQPARSVPAPAVDAEAEAESDPIAPLIAGRGELDIQVEG